jgi:hypothetical protein
MSRRRSAFSRIRRDDIQSFERKTQQLDGYIDGGFDPRCTFSDLWMMPHWGTRDTFYDVVVAKMARDPDDKKTVAVYNALLAYRRESVRNVEAKKAAAARNKVNVEQSFSDFRQRVGKEMYDGIIQLGSELESINKSLTKRHGKDTSGT